MAKLRLIRIYQQEDNEIVLVRRAARTPAWNCLQELATMSTRN